jgi:DNA polymerase-4
VNSPRSILHLDADAFYASVEQATDSRLRGKAMAVGGSTRGIVASASYEARAKGVKTPMPTSQALRLCPELILVPGDFEKYERFSQLMFAYAYDLTPEVEICSIDEGYLDLTFQRSGQSRQSALRLSLQIKKELKITISQGLASNKFCSAVASKMKKPNSFIEVPAGTEKEFLAPLPVRWLPGIGTKTEPRYLEAGITTIHQVASLSLQELERLAGSSAPDLHLFAQGIDLRPVTPASADPKSFGEQETFDIDQVDELFCLATLRAMTDRLCRKLRREGFAARTLSLRIRYRNMEDVMRSESLNEPSPLENDFYPLLQPLLRRSWSRPVPLRLVGVRLSNLHRALPDPELALTGLSQKSMTERLQLAEAADQLRRQFGSDAILRGHDLWLRKKLSAREGGGDSLPSPGKN